MDGMSSARIAPLEPPFAPDVAEHLEKLMPPGVPPLALFRAVAHNPRVLGRMRRGGLLDPGSISVRQRELIILRTTARCGAEYEWGVHVAFFGAAAGFTPQEIAATVRGAPADWAGDERLLVALADALHDGADVPDPLWAELEARFTPTQLVELVFLAGLYHAVSFVTNALRLPREPGTACFPA
jgi:alkylhydroperoxidase family enzyme